MAISKEAYISAQLRLDILGALSSIRGIQTSSFSEEAKSSTSISGLLRNIIDDLEAENHNAEAEALEMIYAKVTDPISSGGLGLENVSLLTTDQHQEILFLTKAWLKCLEYKQKQDLPVIRSQGQQRKPMTLAQKIFYQHIRGVAPEEGISSGHVIRVGIDWVLASELSWSSMARTYKKLGSPGIWRNDRFWLAGDHVVHPSIRDVPKVKAYVETAEKAKREFQMTEYQGMNYTIMHTEFVRERAEPGMLCIGSDSHTCSGGAVGCLSIGLGTADVMMGLSLGETWFKIPESIKIELVGKPASGISGKDVILYILGELKRNTIAAERIVEFDGEAVQYLSIDARFAISNMCTEFGAITGTFVPDAVTKAYIKARKCRRYKANSMYFKPDKDAKYAATRVIDLSLVEPVVARYPNPDDVVPVSAMTGTPLNGVFIGACTTTEEELVLGALILKVGLKQGLPMAKGKKHYVPGSLPIVEALRKLGLLEVYEAAGFTRGPPGCSLCLGLSAEKASTGETWLSSQNRNFPNRMGPGSFGHLSSAVVCAASSFSMTITSPEEFLKEMDIDFFNSYRKLGSDSYPSLSFSEPEPEQRSIAKDPEPCRQENEQILQFQPRNMHVHSKIVTLPDFIDTDALAPGESLTSCTTDEEFGRFVLKYTHPEFRDTVKAGSKVVVAGRAFGVGSSREVAVSALKGVGVEAVIARSFAFIYSRNQPSLGLLGFTIDDDEFYKLAVDGAEIDIDVESRKVTVSNRSFDFDLSAIEYNLTSNNGITECYRQYGKNIWQYMASSDSNIKLASADKVSHTKKIDKRLEW